VYSSRKKRSVRSVLLVIGAPLLTLLALALVGVGLSNLAKPTVPQLPLTTQQTALLAGGIILLVLFVVAAYVRGWWWTGLVPFPSDKEKDTKTLWEWLKLLFVPAVLAAGGYLFTQQQQQQASRIADDQAKMRSWITT
jgi:hypothetical protein